MNRIRTWLVKASTFGALALALAVVVVFMTRGHAGPAEVSSVELAPATWPAPEIVPADALAGYSADRLFLPY
ncbi:hypothetical protein BH09PSE6_BH09PSE6_27370 [soil metagenome]